MDHRFQVKALALSFGSKNIFSCSEIECKTGEIIGIFGRNGAGKSSLFKILFGLVEPDQMELYLDGALWDKKLHLHSFFGYHSQEIMFPKGSLVKTLIPMFILNEENRHKIYYSKGINEMLNIKAGNLSLGQQRYLQFLLILNLDHPFILLDEPFSMVEPLYKTLIKEKIAEYRSTKGFLIADHYYLDVLEIAGKISLIRNGEIIPVANSEDLKTLEYLSEQSILD